MFNSFDSSGNGGLTASEVARGMMRLFGDEGTMMGKALKPAIRRAFHAAKDAINTVAAEGPGGGDWYLSNEQRTTAKVAPKVEESSSEDEEVNTELTGRARWLKTATITVSKKDECWLLASLPSMSNKSWITVNC